MKAREGVRGIQCIAAAADTQALVVYRELFFPHALADDSNIE